MHGFFIAHHAYCLYTRFSVVHESVNLRMAALSVMLEPPHPTSVYSPVWFIDRVAAT